MPARARRSEAGFTLVELTIVVVISTIALLAIYQTLITQEQTYRYQTAAIDAQGSTRVGLQVLASELRELSASAGSAPSETGGSDLLMASEDSLRLRAFRKLGLTCAVDTVAGTLAVWNLGTAFVTGDTLFLFQEGDTLTDEDDTWTSGIPVVALVAPAASAACQAEWPDYTVQGITPAAPLAVATMERGAVVRSYNTYTYGAAQYDGNWVLGRWQGTGSLVPIVGPLLPPDQGGVEFRYFSNTDQQLTPSTQAQLAQVARIQITVRALSRGGPGNADYVDSLTTNVYLRGN